MNRIILSCFLLVSCGYPGPKQIGETKEYELYFCESEIKCFQAAEKTCPNGYTITKYGLRPEKFVCN